MPRRVEANTERLLATFDRAGVHAHLLHPGLGGRAPSGAGRAASSPAGTSWPATAMATSGWTGWGRTHSAPTSAAPRRCWRMPAAWRWPAIAPPTFSLNAAHALGLRHPGRGGLSLQQLGLSGTARPLRHAGRAALPYRPDGGPLWEIPDDHAAGCLAATCPARAAAGSACCPTRCSGWGCAGSTASAAAPGVFYTHPWEYRPGPAAACAVRSPLSRFRHYVNLSRTAGRLERLLADFAWDRMDRVFAGVLGATAHRPASSNERRAPCRSVWPGTGIMLSATAHRRGTPRVSSGPRAGRPGAAARQSRS